MDALDENKEKKIKCKYEWTSEIETTGINKK